MNYYKSYSFRLYLEKIRLLLFQIVSVGPSFFSGSVTSLDIAVFQNLVHVIKSFSFFYLDCNSIHFKFNSFNLKRNLSSKFSNKDFVENLMFNSFCIFERLVDFKIKVLMPIKYLFEQFRNLGFIHSFKIRPVGNIRYVSYSDFLIIKSFGYIAFSILFWFRVAQNFSSAKVFLEFLRNSCLLTLCRKHNKGKVWAFSIYTSNLLLLRMFDNFSCL
uniref:Domain X domain-containing protein n=1 Tax=Trachelomonas grandis TaxID=215769 RepID=A0A385UK45_9EUGL|nr:hypothetical protein [Trachelomonas grandis]